MLFQLIIHWDVTQIILKEIDPYCLYALCTGPINSSHCPKNKNNNWIINVDNKMKLNLICVCPANF